MFSPKALKNLLPEYLSASEKDRLGRGLSQFQKGRTVNYERFYRTSDEAHFFQADVVREIRVPQWNSNTGFFEKAYTDALILSNTCDISPENDRSIQRKQCMFAPILNLGTFCQELRENGRSDKQVESFADDVRRQRITNLFYLPDIYNSEGAIAILDRLFWFPTEELNIYLREISENRLKTLDYFGHYMFIFKLSYHFCRLPESPPNRNS